MSKVIFVVHRRSNMGRAVQNHVVSAPGEPICDGVGELWFASDARWSRP